MPPLFLEWFASEQLSLAKQEQEAQKAVSDSLSEFGACSSPRRLPALGVGSGSAQSEGCHHRFPEPSRLGAMSPNLPGAGAGMLGRSGREGGKEERREAARREAARSSGARREPQREQPGMRCAPGRGRPCVRAALRDLPHLCPVIEPLNLLCLAGSCQTSAAHRVARILIATQRGQRPLNFRWHPARGGCRRERGRGELMSPHRRAAAPMVQEGMRHTLPWGMSCSPASWRGHTELLPPLLQPIPAPRGYRRSRGTDPKQLS